MNDMTIDMLVVPDFSNAEECQAFLRGLPWVEQPESTQDFLLMMLQSMQSRPPAAADHIGVLEGVRPILHSVQEKLSQWTSEQPFPPHFQGETVFQRQVRGWELMARNYSKAILSVQRDGGTSEFSVLAYQRLIRYTGEAILEHFRARRQVPAGLWRMLHIWYSAAENHGLATASVVDSSGAGEWRTSCRETYASVLLVALASPYGLSRRQLDLTIAWARQFSGYVKLKLRDETRNISGFAVDLRKNQPPRPTGAADSDANLRIIETAALGRALQRVREHLKDGGTPLDLGLGEDCSVQGARQLLRRLARPWGTPRDRRPHARRDASGNAALCGGFARIHRELRTDDIPASPTDSDQTVFVPEEEVAPDDRRGLLHLGGETGRDGMESWSLVDEALCGVGLRRPANGQNVEHNQLVGAVLPGTRRLLLGRVAWLSIARTGDEVEGDQLAMGVRLLPGRPEAITARLVTRRRAKNAVQPAFLLPAVPGLGEPASLVVPRGWARDEDALELSDERGVRRVEITRILTKGRDFERLAYATVS